MFTILNFNHVLVIDAAGKHKVHPSAAAFSFRRNWNREKLSQNKIEAFGHTKAATSLAAEK